MRVPRWAKQISSTVLIFPLLGAVQNARAPNNNVNDFIAYWTAGRLVLQGENPYSQAAALRLEREAGFTQAEPLIMRNPPWTSVLVMPLGFLSYAVAQRLWFAVCLVAVFVSALWLRRLYCDGRSSPWIACVALGMFSPISVALAIGQISPLVLLGIAGFLYFEDAGKHGWAGVFLFPVTFKPHVVFLFYAALMLWSIRPRNLRPVLSLCSVIGVASAIAVMLDRSIFSHYFELLSVAGVVRELTPTIGGALRLWLGAGYLAQALPAVLALVWLVLYWSVNRVSWTWKEQTPLMLAVSVATSPYGWLFDQVVVLPCVFQSLGWSGRSVRPVQVCIACLYVAVNVAILALIVTHHTTFWYAWVAPAWLFLFVVSAVGERVPSSMKGAERS